MIKQTFKRIAKNEGLRRFLCWIGAQYIRFVIVTTRWTVINGDVLTRFWADDQPFIVCFWHGRILMMPHCWPRGRNFHMLISQHRDGQLIANTVAHFGIDTIPGSSTRGGAQALRGMLKCLKAGDCIGMTPDGPRGPRMRASEGIVNVARLASVPIVPSTFGVSRGKVLGTWDRFLVAWPFSKGVAVWGDPIWVARDDDVEVARQAVEDGLNWVTAEADRLTGRDPVKPAERPMPSDQGPA